MIQSLNIDAFPKLRQAIVEIAYDNGCVNRGHTEQEVVENAFEACAASFDPSELRRVNDFLALLPKASFDRLCTGEQHDPADPPSEIEELVNAVLDHAFENLL